MYTLPLSMSPCIDLQVCAVLIAMTSFPSLVTPTQETARLSAASGQISQRAYTHTITARTVNTLRVRHFILVLMFLCLFFLLSALSFIPSYYSKNVPVYCQVRHVQRSINHWNVDGVDKVIFPRYLGGRSVTELEEEDLFCKRVEQCFTRAVCVPVSGMIFCALKQYSAKVSSQG